MEKLKQAWWPVANSNELPRGSPLTLAKKVLGTDVVLFRGSEQAVIALEDRCPHRNVSLSLGKAEGGKLRCAYHGWTFNGEGHCVDVPCLSGAEKAPKASVKRFRCLEKDDTLWVCLDQDSPVECPGWHSPPGGNFSSFEIRKRIHCPMIWILDNFVDCGHTGFVHAGLFRGAPQHEVRAKLEETPTGLRVETVGESQSKSLLSKLWVRGDGQVEHVDEYILPHTVKVNYRFGNHWIQTISICRPEDDGATEVFTRVWVRFGWFSPLVAKIVERLTEKILEQDRAILENQALQLQRYGGPQFTSSAADVPTSWLSRVFKEYLSGKFPSQQPRKTEVSYRL